MVEDILKQFDVFNDQNFKFDPILHKYTYNGRKYISVTQFLQNFHEKFDTEFWSNKKAEDLGIPQEDILKQWKEKNDYANFVGTQTHNWIENYYNKIYQELPTNIDVIDRINKFNVIYSKYLYKLTPVIFEIRIFSKKYPLAGTIDSIFLYKGKLFIIDWKTNSSFKHDDHPKGKYQKLLTPFDEFYQNHLNEYSIQVSLYSLILEEWGIPIRGAYLVHFGPDSEAKLYKTQDMRTHLKEYLETFNWN
jgi:ATP-dependent exoDNAse (exonuclease V) beta subunit